MASTQQWVAGARPRTLPMAVAPVVIGSSAAASMAAFDPGIALLAALVALALQVGVNYANDYSDGVRGTDDDRVGPMRLTGSGAAEPGQVKAAAFGCFGIAGMAGVLIVLLSGHWWMLIVGAVSVLAAWWYTGGSKPYGYMGLGEVMVFVFFGLVATLGTTYAMADQLSQGTWLGAISHGLIASALLMANNVRDIPTDRAAGKITLAVRLGERSARLSYVGMILGAVALPLLMLHISPWFLLSLASVVFCLGPSRIMLSAHHRGPALIRVLQLTGILSLVFAATYSVALLLS
ncbi:1,4-dihydroxy-2-naphthoate polyprenyltransferase [Nesterenkonia marinintestina]|uniref:1,4-dihydroxy-2-naphthoate polyprenyltransferase n=1 Tax=Nesterenkonia marinintestina TaxID=2979865 RepID=UPI0021C1211A|nr:1,4-dihydroxy-2-naphthoate polyprenyltransferase [Nesterenkonia sp. GX14115]